MTRQPPFHSVEEGAFPLGMTAAEQAFVQRAEEIAREVSQMSEAQIADYLVDNDLQHLVAPDRIEAILETAIQNARRRDEGRPTPALVLRRRI